MAGFTPIGGSQRIEALDVARGVAVLGILIMNIWAFSGPQPFFDYPLAIADQPGAPVQTWAVMNTLFEGSQRTLLSMLFGAGMLLLILRLERIGTAGVAGIYYRRTVALICFGLVNAYLFMWPADILFAYGLAGLLLYPLRRLGARSLLLIALLVLMIPTALRIATLVDVREQLAAYDTAMEVRAAGDALDEAGEEAIERWQQSLQEARPDAADERIRRNIQSIGDGGIVEVFLTRARTSLILQTIVLVRSWFTDALAAMVIGMALYRAGWLSPDTSRRVPLLMTATGLSIGIPLGIWVTWTLLAGNFHPLDDAVTGLVYDVRRFALGLGYLGLILLLCRTAGHSRFRHSLAAVGRMALSNYLAQSIICAFIFYGFGLGLYGQVTGYWVYLVVIGIWSLQLAWSGWWLSHFRFGPAEWLWRTMAYRPGAMPALRMPSALP